MNLTFSTEAALTKQMEMPAWMVPTSPFCSPHHAFHEFYTFGHWFGERASNQDWSLSLPRCHSLILPFTFLHTHTFFSVTNEPAVKLMFCNHRANCRYPVSAPTAANALDLSLGVHLKNLRESWSQWSEGEEEKKPFHQQPSLSIRPLAQKGLQLLCNYPLTFCHFSHTWYNEAILLKSFCIFYYSNVVHKVSMKISVHVILSYLTQVQF